ncbi:helix-turn-helix domain-containing protein [Ferrimonas balearica]|uniref:GlxA family transcriptional regulator n=1 Tax=Ferrimonas balearica TaxID=44012 RepID=UPI001C95D8BA|nr:helix-turn-helix domain-containing protein [Ferrimonas balearica]MBY6106730.1 helix-turn-helix domain-containing protein [Ferrimonas balearica]
MTKPRIVVIAYEGISPLYLSIPCAVFHDAFQYRECPFELEVCSLHGRELNALSGFSLSVDADLHAVERADVVIVPGWADAISPAPKALLEALITAHQRGAIVVGLCLGAGVLAQSGLLDGLSATTHWAFADAFAEAYPSVRVDPDPLYLDHGQVVTSAGMAAAMDCCLHLLRRLLGTDRASEVARVLVAPPYRHGGQKQYIPAPVPRPRAGEGTLGRVMEAIQMELAAPHTVASVAERCAMSRRTFTRQFQAYTGMSFIAWLTARRLAHSQHLLEHSDLAISQVAEQAGFGSESVFRKHFKAAFELSPRAWRQSFGQRQKGE